MNTLLVCSKLRITVEINTPSNWGAHCQLKQIHKQSVDCAIETLRKAAADNKISIVGKIKVLSVVVETE